LLPLLVTSLLAGACSQSQAALPDRCVPSRLETVRPGKLTLSTGVITRSPWVVGSSTKGRSPDPHNGKGYDAAVGYALAQRLGFERSAVTWMATPFGDALAAGAKKFDVNINQATIRDDRRTSVDLTRPYYSMRQAVVSIKGRPVTDASSLKDLGKARLAFISGSPAQNALGTLRATGVADDNELRRGLTNGEHDAVLTSFLTAMRYDSDESHLVDGELVGVLAAGTDSAEEYGMVLQRDSPLTDCVNTALTEMEKDGTLERLERKWLVEENGWTWFE